MGTEKPKKKAPIRKVKKPKTSPKPKEATPEKKQKKAPEAEEETKE